MRNFLVYIVVIISSLLLCCCSVQKYIPENEKLYTGATMDVETNDTIQNVSEIASELEPLFRPKPNTKILGIRLGLLAHYKSQREKPGFFYKFLNKKLGEEPVYLSDLDIATTEELIDNRLENRGFFENKIRSEIIRNAKTGSATYTVQIKNPYRLETYRLDTLPSPLESAIKKTMPETLIQKEDRFDLALFKQERERIDFALKKKGYYNFNADFMIFEADTNQYKNKRFDLFLRLKKEVPPKSIVPYLIEDIRVYPNYVSDQLEITKDTTKLEGIKFIQDPTFFKPKRLAPYILFEEGQVYNPKISKRTSKRLSSIGTYKFVNIRYEELDSINDGTTPKKLRANIFLSPLKKRSLRLELQAVSKSNNFAGPTLQARFSNRNLFKGGETLNITTTLGYETQIGGKNTRGLSSIQLGAGSDLIFPRLLFPIKIDRPFEYAIPSTKISLQGELLDRSKLYRLASFSTTFGYEWNANRFVFHGLNPISINYTNLSNTTTEFENILTSNEFLRSSFDQQFIAGLTYTFLYNEIGDPTVKNAFFTKVNFDIAGNLVGLFAKSNPDNDGKPQTFLGLEYAQYAKIDVDFRYHFNLGNKQQLVSRLFAGIGKPYGNSRTLPFIKQFFSGGPYSVRAFRIRSLGPGSYTPPAPEPQEDEEQVVSGDFFDRAGDIRLEANVEYRFPLFPYFYGAVFADAGNVWLINENPDLMGGKFSSNFLNELGVGTGVGVRIDIQNFVIRFDLAAPLADPSDTTKSFNLDVKNPILNFAIGYPF